MGKVLPTLGLLVIIALPACSFAATFTLPLSVGSRGAEVRALQHTLANLGYFTAEATGYFGPLTRQAIFQYQKENNLEPVGFVGPRTRALLNAAAEGRATAPVPPANTAPALQESGATTSSVFDDAEGAGAASSTVTSPDMLAVTLVSPPSILPTDTLSTNLVVTTNRAATCRWSTNPDFIFTRMTLFTATDGTTHTYTFTNLSNGYWYVYYVKCLDNETLRISGDTVVSFTISSTSAAAENSSPYASIVSQLTAAAGNTTTIGELWHILSELLVVVHSLVRR